MVDWSRGGVSRHMDMGRGLDRDMDMGRGLDRDMDLGRSLDRDMDMGRGLDRDMDRGSVSSLVVVVGTRVLWRGGASLVRPRVVWEPGGVGEVLAGRRKVVNIAPASSC